MNRAEFLAVLNGGDASFRRAILLLADRATEKEQEIMYSLYNSNSTKFVEFCAGLIIKYFEE